MKKRPRQVSYTWDSLKNERSNKVPSSLVGEVNMSAHDALQELKSFHRNAPCAL